MATNTTKGTATQNKAKTTKTKTSMDILKEIREAQKKNGETLDELKAGQQRNYTAIKQTLDATLKGMEGAHKGTRAKLDEVGEHIIDALNDHTSGFAYIGMAVLAILITTAVHFIFRATIDSKWLVWLLTIMNGIFCFFAIEGFATIIKRFVHKK